MSSRSGATWVGYAVPVSRRDRESGCWADNDLTRPARVGPLKLEGPDALVVLYRVADRSVKRIRIASPECPLDTGGLTLHWLTGVRPGDSVEWLTTLATGDHSQRLANDAVMAIALHGDALATDRLLALARTGPSGNVRSLRSN